MRKLLITSVSLLGIVCLLLGSAFWFREDLARFAAGRFLADGELTLTRLQGLQLTSTQLSVDELEFLLNNSGQRLVIVDLDVAFRVTSVSSAPSVEAITIGSAQLLAASVGEEGTTDVEDDAAGSGTMLSEVLTLLREFPLASVTVDALTLPRRSVPIAFELQRGDGRLSTQVQSGVLRLEAVFTQADEAAAANLAVSLTRGDASVGAFELVLTPVDTVYALTGSGNLDVPDLAALLGDFDQAPLALPLAGAQLDWDIAGSVADDLRGVASNEDPQTFVVGLQAGSQVTLPAELASGLGEVTIAFTDRTAFTINSGAGLTLSSSGLPLHVTSTWKEQAVDLAALMTLTDCELAAAATCNIGFNGNAALGEYNLAGAIAVALQGDGKYHVATEGLALTGLPDWLPAFDVAADIAVNEQTISFSTPLILRNASADAGITLDGDYDRTSSAAEVHAALPELTFMEAGGALSTRLSAWPYTFDLLTGSLAAEADLTWNAGMLTGNLSANLKDTGGFYGDYFFRGVNGNLQANLDTGAELPVGIAPTTLTAVGLDIGVPMENLRLAFSLDSAGILQIASFSTELLDGTISGMDITYDFNRERNDVLVQFSGLQIERMLELIEYKGIAAEGAVSGEIPLTLTSTGVEVAAGRLAADAPGGSIRYLAAATAATGNPGLDLMNQALSNYQFESLTSGIEYKSDGELVLDMKLVGHNPEMQGGQRINLNLNLSDNIPALLESLRAARKIEDFLELQYQ